MIKKLKKHGNSQVLLIEKSILRLLGWSVAQEVEITTNGRSLVVTPVRKEAAK